MNPVRALILCNNPIAIPGIKEFLFFGKGNAIGIPESNKEMKHLLEQLLPDTGVSLILLNKQNYRQMIRETILEKEITVSLMFTFPYIIPEEILQLPEKGFINFHFGLLPQCRGPQPILSHMLNNDADAGITVHQADSGIDTGAIIIQEKIAIAANDTYGTLQGKLAMLGAKQAATLLKILSYGSTIPSKPQDESMAAYYKMPGAKELTIKWQEMNGAQIQRMVQACNPWNKGAGTILENWMIGVTEVEITGDSETGDLKPGTIIACNPMDGLLVQTCDSKKLKLNIIYIQEGFFSGYRLAGFGVQPGQQFK
jgi:methionyl-tRNA formyltransferase